jgi:hypothetical protein
MDIRMAKWLALVVASSAVMAGCGDGNGGSDGSTGTLRLALTDGPIDGADHVWIQFEGLELKLTGDGPPEFYKFDPEACSEEFSTQETCTIDLLALQGIKLTTIFAKDVPEGEYEWIRMMVNADQNKLDSYIDYGDRQCPLWIPSGGETGLKLQGGIEVTTAGAAYILDLDLNKSVLKPPGLAETPTNDIEACVDNYLLKPVIRIVEEDEAGSIAGVIDESLLYTTNDMGEPVLVDGCRDEGEDGMTMDGVVDSLKVYVFEDFDATAEADDYDGDGDPVSSAVVEYDIDSMTYSYEVGFLLNGDYLLGLTCTGDVDLQEEDNFPCDGEEPSCVETDPPFSFIAEQVVTAIKGKTIDGSF